MEKHKLGVVMTIALAFRDYQPSTLPPTSYSYEEFGRQIQAHFLG